MRALIITKSRTGQPLPNGNNKRSSVILIIKSPNNKFNLSCDRNKILSQLFFVWRKNIMLFKRKIKNKNQSAVVIGFGAAGLRCVEYIKRLGFSDFQYITVDSKRTAFLKDYDCLIQNLQSAIGASKRVFVIIQPGGSVDYSFLKRLPCSKIYAVMPSDFEYHKHRQTAVRTVRMLKKHARIHVVSLNKLCRDKCKSYPLHGLMELYITAPICTDIIESR